MFPTIQISDASDITANHRYTTHTPPTTEVRAVIIPILTNQRYTMIIATHHDTKYQIHYVAPSSTPRTKKIYRGHRVHVRRELATLWPLATQAHNTPDIITHTNFQKQTTSHDCGIHVIYLSIQLVQNYTINGFPSFMEQLQLQQRGIHTRRFRQEIWTYLNTAKKTSTASK